MVEQYNKGFLSLYQDVLPQVLLRTKPAERQFLVSNMLPSNTTAVLSSQGGVGKSNLALLMAAAIASGRSICPFNVPEARKVVVINVEDSADDIHRRYYALEQKYQFTFPERLAIDNNLVLVAGRGKVGSLMHLDKSGNPVATEYFAWLQSLIETEKPDLIIYDSKGRLYGLDENSNDHATRWWNLLESTMLLHPCTHLVITNEPHGGSAFIDNAGLHFSLQAMSLTEGEMYGVEYLDYYSLHDIKNCSYQAGGTAYFRKMKEGIPVLVELNN